MKEKVGNVLLDLNITPNLNGFNYICDAIEIISEEKAIRTCLLYEEVSKRNESTPTKVERAIRHAFSKIDKESENFKKYFGVKKLTNSSLLFTLYFKLKEEIEN